MTIPADRATLVRRATEGFADLERALDVRDDAPFPTPATPADPAAAPPRDRDAADVVNHLHAWHVLLLGWLAAAASGGSAAYPADGYRWRDLDRLNRDLRDRYRDDGDLDRARDRLRASHASALARLDAMTDAAIFVEPRAWLGDATLAEPVHECLGGHYAWAIGALGAPAGGEDASGD
ncbi:ClbS/DfsB family four-helix bundle protein [Agromyces sp. SYSU T0242]|uniref:ClbS/DfsB family four-helix bundle protein n=1 Tax=Agromyces litoreus TaxID=3158561 RepID=UPI0033951B42